MRIVILSAALAMCIAGAPTASEAQTYMMRTRLQGLGTAAASPTPTPTPPPTEYKGTWANTGQQSAGVCNNGSRRIDWVYGCRVSGVMSSTDADCDPAKKPDTLSHNQSCSSVCGSLDQPGYVGGGNSQTVNGTLAEMKAQARTFCEGVTIRPDLSRSCSLIVDDDNPNRGRMIVSYDFGTLPVTNASGSWHASCSAAS